MYAVLFTLTVIVNVCQLKKRCNSSDVCMIRLLDYLKFPGHLKDYVYMHAYQPIVIQVIAYITYYISNVAVHSDCQQMSALSCTYNSFRYKLCKVPP